MKLDLTTLTTERQWRSATGFNKDKFDLLLVHFQESYETIYGKTIEQRTSESPNSPTITNCANLLFFTLFSLKSGLTYDLLGFVSGWMVQMPNEIRHLVWMFLKMRWQN